MVVISLDGTLVVQITEAQIVADTVCCTRDAGVIVLVKTSTEGGIFPIIGPAGQEVLHDESCIGIETHTTGIKAEH